MKNAAVVFKLFWQVVLVFPRLFAIEYFFTALGGVCLAVIAIATENLFSNIILYAKGASSLYEIILAIIISGAIYIVSQISSGVSNYCGELYADRTNQKFHDLINKKIAGISAIHFENPESLNDIHKSYVAVASSRNIVNIIMDILMLYVPYFAIGNQIIKCDFCVYDEIPRSPQQSESDITEIEMPRHGAGVARPFADPPWIWRDAVAVAGFRNGRLYLSGCICGGVYHIPSNV